MSADDISDFLPGERLHLPSGSRPCSPQEAVIRVRFPGRIHISPVDCNRFALGSPGGGGLGFAVQLDNHLSVNTAASDRITAPSYAEPLLRHYLALTKRLFEYRGGLDVSFRSAPELSQHSGLGSSAMIATAYLQCVNLIFGEPLKHSEVRALVGHNFVEPLPGRVAPGLETGVGTYVALHGGMVLMGDSLVPLYATAEFNELPVLLVFLNVKRPVMDRPESMEMLNRSRALDASYRYTRAYRMMMDIVPALARRDLKSAGDVIWDFQFSGTHQSMIQAYDDGGLAIINMMTFLRRSGCEIVGMSSVGPLVYAASSELPRLQAAAQRIDPPLLLTSISSGLTVEHAGQARPPQGSQ